MEKITMTKYQKLSNEQKMKTEERIINGKFIGIEKSNGLEWTRVRDNSGEELLITQEVEREAAKYIFNQLEDLLNKNKKGEFVSYFKFALDRYYKLDYWDDLVKKIDHHLLASIYATYKEEMSKANINVFTYVVPEELYEILNDDIAYMKSTNKELNTQKYTEEYIDKYEQARENCIKEVERVIEEVGGEENWINEREKNIKKSHNLCIKDILLEKVISNSLSEDEKEKYAKLLIKVGINSSELETVFDQGMLPMSMIEGIHNIPSMKEVIEDAVSKFKVSSMILALILNEDETIFDGVIWTQITPQRLKEAIAEEDYMKATMGALFIKKMYHESGRKLSEQEIDMIFESKSDDKIDILRAYYELAEEGLYNDDKVINAYYEMIMDQTKQELTEKQLKEREISMISTGEILSLFTTDRVIEKLMEYDEIKDKEEADKDKRKFITYYSRVLESHASVYKERTEEILNELKTKLQAGIENRNVKYLQMAIELNEFGVITEQMLKEIITPENEDMIFDLYEKGISDNVLLNLYKSNMITDNVISLIYDDQLSSNKLEKKIQNNEITKENIVILLLNGVLDEKKFNGMNFEGLDWKKILKQSQGVDFVNKIASLYNDEVIGFDEVKELKEQEVITAKDAELILNQLDLDAILIKGLTSEEGVGEKRSGVKRGESKKKEGIALEDRDELLNSLGFEAVKNARGEALIVAEGSFKGYRVYRDKDRAFRVIVFEGLKDGSSFIMHEAKAGEFIRTEDNEASLIGSRSEWREKARTSGSVTAKLHTNQWGNNIIQAIVDTSSTFKFDDEQDRKEFVKQETKRLQEENRDLVEYISLLKKEEKAR